MATVDGITVAKAQQIENKTIVNAVIDPGSGELLLTTAGGTVINAGQAKDLSLPAALNAHAQSPSTHDVGEIAGLTETQSMSNKTLVLPIIESFINAQHTHGSPAQGGELSIGQADSPAPVTSLTERTLSDQDATDGVEKVLASLTCPAGRWLLLATCQGVTLADNTKARFLFDLKASQPSLQAKGVSSSSETTALDGGRALYGWLENSVNSSITFTIKKNGAGALITTSTVGMLMAVRMG